MPYTTPTAYLHRFGLAEAVQMLADEEQLLTATLLQQAIAVAAGGTWPVEVTQPERDAGAAALARLVRAIDVSGSLMDSYLRSAVTLPLSADDANAGTLADCCLALARCNIADDCDNATDRIDKACEQWRKWLDDVARKRVQLVNPAGATPPGPAGVRSGQAASSYPWGSFGGVR